MQNSSVDMRNVALILNALLQDDRLKLLDENTADGLKRINLFKVALAPYMNVRSVAHSKVAQKYGIVERGAKVYQASGYSKKHQHTHNKACLAFWLLDLIIESGVKDARNVGRFNAARVYLTRNSGVKEASWLTTILDDPTVDLAIKASDLKGFVINHYYDVSQAQLDCFAACPEAHMQETE